MNYREPQGEATSHAKLCDRLAQIVGVFQFTMRDSEAASSSPKEGIAHPVSHHEIKDSLVWAAHMQPITALT